MKPLSHELSRPPYRDLGAKQRLRPLFRKGARPTLKLWRQARASLLKRWRALLGAPSFDDFDHTPEVVGQFRQPEYTGTIIRQPTGPRTRQLLLMMEPVKSPFSPRPGAVVPFYHPDSMAGFDLQKREPMGERPNVQFGRHLVQQGYVVVCTEAFPYNTVPEPQANEGFAWWRAGAMELLRENPGWTGIAKLAWDTSRAVDLLLSRPDMDTERIVAVGHSLGGKMAFYAGALDERIKAVIGSDFGLGWKFTNWDAPWYLGEAVNRRGFALAHHQLLALTAPRAFLLIGGEADRPESWQYIVEARKVYKLYKKTDAVGFFDHGSGHSPTEESLRKAYRWLAEQFDLPEQPWEL